ncbi:N-acetylmuramoyl-L-alanine amidase family protein [Leadbettera azotonutricia]|uniref:N-acetylmuramoyl-L-alanine amidase n=1 Tax=Leadbettera azotonutricia (strain ATCC BAA-888 / DSM 13862 / ZAS-9) TaxID=545695 RepID=F5Y6R5_LEAAZ|nr:N-acetylmuramoyl-L-alanine amidase [Leadbettera azotonutricia]AEF80474.1 N-acetylmuramoyl-L-alanine amidase, family 3 [Leadbettera azotonutricia ZAS-9]
MKNRGFFSLSLFFLLLLAINQLPAQTLTLDDALKNLGQAELRWDPFLASGVFSAEGHNAAFSSGSQGETGPVLFDNREILDLPLPYTDQGGMLRFPEAFVARVKNTFSRYAEEDKNRFRIAAIIVDPGHGGKDEGAVGSHTVNGKPLKSVEKEIALKVSLLLHARLAAAFPDKRVLLTRDSDTFPTLEDRVSLANAVPLKDNEAAIYISIHANASFNKAARGYEVWYLSPGYRRELIDKSKYADSKEVIPILNTMIEEEITTESILMARSILGHFDRDFGKIMPSRGLKAEEWFVVRNARMPSVLVELGFVTNEADAVYMNGDTHLKDLSEALYKGIIDFVALFERTGGFTASQ